MTLRGDVPFSKRSSVDLAWRTSVLETLMYIFCIAFWISGAIAIGIGVWIRQGRALPYSAAFGDEYSDGYVVLITAGLVVCLTGFLGLAAVYSERKQLAFLYSLLVGITLALFLAMAGWSFAGSRMIEDVISMEFPASMERYANDRRVQTAIDKVQTERKCCGLNSHLDWMRTSWAKDKPAGSVPDSCCSTLPASVGCGLRSKDRPWAVYSGCRPALEKILFRELRDTTITTVICSAVLVCVLVVAYLYWRHLARGLHLIWPQTTDVVIIEADSVKGSEGEEENTAKVDESPSLKPPIVDV